MPCLCYSLAACGGFIGAGCSCAVPPALAGSVGRRRDPVTAVGLGYRYLAPDSETGAIYRTQEGDWLQSAIPEPEPLARDYLVLSWTAGPEGTVYDVQIMGEDLQPLARRLQITDTEYHVPPELVADLPSGSLLYWQVVAYLPDGRTVESISFMNRLE